MGEPWRHLTPPSHPSLQATRNQFQCSQRNSQPTNQPFHKQNSQQPTIQTTEQTGTAAVSEKDDQVVVNGDERKSGQVLMVNISFLGCVQET